MAIPLHFIKTKTSLFASCRNQPKFFNTLSRYVLQGRTKWQKRFTKLRSIQLPLLITVMALLFAIVIFGIDKKKPNSQSVFINQKDSYLVESVALGASSGGYFVSMLASKMKFSSIAIMIAEGIFDQIDVIEHYPPSRLPFSSTCLKIKLGRR